MNNKLLEEDYKNLLALIAITPINGAQAMTVAVLQQKLNSLLQPLSPTEGTAMPQEAEK